MESNDSSEIRKSPERCVLVTVGTTRFDALVRAVDSPAFAAACTARGYTALVIQAGASESYRPCRLVPPGAQSATLPSGLSVRWFEYAPSLASALNSAELVVSHAGAGSVFEALRRGAALIAVPNATLMDDHQKELAGKLAERGHLAVASPETLSEVLMGLETEKLVPYEGGNPVGIVARVDALCSVIKRQ